MKQYSKKNGYFKYYNKDGVSLRIKIDMTRCHFEPQHVLISFTHSDGSWVHHIPEKKFTDIHDIVNHVCRNTENKNVVFRIGKITKKIK